MDIFFIRKIEIEYVHQVNYSSKQTTSISTSMFLASSFTNPAHTKAITHSQEPTWQWTEQQYRDLVTLYMDFVDGKERNDGTPPNNPHHNQELVNLAFVKFSHVAPRNCIRHALKNCHFLEEEPYEVTMNPMTELKEINSTHRSQWNIMKVQRIKDQLAHYQHQLQILMMRDRDHHDHHDEAAAASNKDNKQAMRVITRKIEERQRCLQLNPLRYYRPGP